MEIYKTNAALGYSEEVILLHIEGFLYMVIDKHTNGDDDYELGERSIFTDEEKDVYLKKISYNIKRSPLSGKFLFDNFISLKFG